MSSKEPKSPAAKTPKMRPQWGSAIGMWLIGSWFLISSSLTQRWQRARLRPEAGMATAEYAIVTLAAVAFAGLLLVILRSGEIRGMLLGIIQRALSA